MTSEEIRIELFKRRRTSSMAILARKLGVTRQAVYNTIDRRHKSLRIASAVSEAIDRPLVEVFPELVDPDQELRSAVCGS